MIACLIAKTLSSRVYGACLSQAYSNKSSCTDKGTAILAYWKELFSQDKELSVVKGKASAEAISDIASDSKRLGIIQRHLKSPFLPDVLTKECMNFYHNLPSIEKKEEFLSNMAQELSITRQQWSHIVESISVREIQGEDTYDAWNMKLERLRQSLTPLYGLFFQQIIMEREGLLFLLALRTDLLSIIRSSRSFSLRTMDEYLKEQLIHWYSPGFLTLKEITWESSTASVIETISQYEAVHPPDEFIHMKFRLNGINRRCFAFCHVTIPETPAAFISVALMPSISAEMSSILAPVDTVSCGQEQTCTSAVFYSISATQKGLSGIDLGSSLIKQVMHKLASEQPTIKHYSTLSPIPGFRKWLQSTLVQENHKQSPSDPCLWTDLHTVANDPTQLIAILAQSTSEYTEKIRASLMKYCTRYLYNEKWKGRAINQVANFHLKNGAILWRICWLADESIRGLDSSLAMMVNYYYNPSTIDSNSGDYTLYGTIHTGPTIQHNE